MALAIHWGRVGATAISGALPRAHPHGVSREALDKALLSGACQGCGWSAGQGGTPVISLWLGWGVPFFYVDLGGFLCYIMNARYTDKTFFPFLGKCNMGNRPYRGAVALIIF